MQLNSEAIDPPEYSGLYVFSDGIHEVAGPGGKMMKYSEFVDVLAASKRGAGSVIEETFDVIRTARGSDRFEDDVSIVEVAF